MAGFGAFRAMSRTLEGAGFVFEERKGTNADDSSRRHLRRRLEAGPRRNECR